jgi:hypothetical protein
LINQEPAYQAVYQFFLKSGQPFTFKPEAVWKDLKRTGYISEFEEGRCTKVATIYGDSKRCVWLKAAILQDTSNDSNLSDILSSRKNSSFINQVLEDHCEAR